MEVSDVRVRVVDNANDRLKAVCTVTFDEAFVVRDVKIVEGSHGLFVAMPSRKLTAPCPKCRTQNHLRARHCNDCGDRLPPMRITCDEAGREKAHRDMAHPINATFRQTVEDCVLKAYETELERLGSEGAQADTGEDDFDNIDSDTAHEEESQADSSPMAESQPVADDNDGDDLEVVEKDTSGSGQMSEYNSLIADLRGGSNNPSGQRGRGGRSSSRSGSQSDSRTSSQAGSQTTSQAGGESSDDRGKRPRRSRGGRGRSRKPESSRDGDSSPRNDSDSAPKPDPAQQVAQTPPSPAPSVCETPPTPEPRKPEPKHKKEAAPSPVTSFSFDDTQAFGAGLAEEPKSKPKPKPKKKAAAKPAPVKEETVSVDQKPDNGGSPPDENAFGAGLL